MIQTAEIIHFPRPKPGKKCCACETRFPQGLDGSTPGCNANFDPNEKLIVTFRNLEHGNSLFQLRDDNLPSDEAGDICDNCIDALIAHDRLNDVSSFDEPPSYELSFRDPGSSAPGYGFLCYDQTSWEKFLAVQRKNLGHPNLKATSVPAPKDFPCLVICRGLTSTSLGPRMLDVDLLRQTLIILNAS